MCLCLCIDHSSCSKESHNYNFPDRHCCKDSTCTEHDKCLVPPNHPSNKLVRFDSGDSTCKMSTWHVIFLQEAMLKLWAPLSSRTLLQAFTEKLFRFGQFSLLVEHIGKVVFAAQRIYLIVTELGTASASRNEAGLPREWCIQSEKKEMLRGSEMVEISIHWSLGTVHKTSHGVGSLGIFNEKLHLKLVKHSSTGNTIQKFQQPQTP